MQLFYEPLIKETLHLNTNDSKHCVKVLRKQTGDVIHIVDGNGSFFKAKISESSPKRCRVELLDETLEWQKPHRYIHIAIAPTKNLDRINYFVEKAVEIGISEISFILCKHSERKVIKTERVERVAIAAMKQSLKAYLPKINPIQSLDEFAVNNKCDQKLVAHLRDGALDLMAVDFKNDIILLIGPEGDFDEKELSLLASKGFQNITLGKSRLRTETAGIVATTILNLK